MKAVVFYLCICFLFLSGGNSRVVAHIHQNIFRYTLSQGVEKKQPLQFTNAAGGGKLIKNISLRDELACLVNDDVEEEDANDLFVKKYESTSSSHLGRPIRFFQSISGYQHNCLHPSLFFRIPASCKYILQRSLRI